MSKYTKQLCTVLGIGLVLFYLVPLIFLVLNVIPAHLGMGITILMLLIVNVIYSFISGLNITKKNGFKWYLPMMIGVLFLPTVYLFYNNSALFYSAAYAVISGIGCGIGYGIRVKNQVSVDKE